MVAEHGPYEPQAPSGKSKGKGKGTAKGKNKDEVAAPALIGGADAALHEP